MPLHDLAFYLALFFIIGVFIASAVSSPLLAFSSIISLSTAFYFYNKKQLAALTLCALLGIFYYLLYDHYQKSPQLVFDQPIEITAVVGSVEIGEKSQAITINNLKIYIQKYPEYSYGDKILIRGEINKPEPPFSDYLFKEGVVAVVRYPQISLVAKGEGNVFLAHLYNIKNNAIKTFKSILPSEKAQFLAGITLGEKANFSESFKDELSKSGTSHLVALSGYNITILAEIIALMFLFTIGNRPALIFSLSLASILLFVLMTGAEASIVRAAIMGGIMLLADRVGRVYNFRNSITIVAAIMILYNPKVLVFDIGFQLSFAALLGIVYIRPILNRLLKFDFNPGTFEWKKNLTTTFSAQLAVFPILLTNFGSASFSGLFANILVLMLIPYTMLLGFLMAIFSYFSNIAAELLGYIANILLSYELLVIKVISQFGYIDNFVIGSWFMVVYYALLIVFMYYINKNSKNQATNYK